MAITYIEGLPCAGKSFLIKALEKKSMPIIHELGRVLDKSKFPGNGRNAEEVKEIDNRFIQKEAERLTNLSRGEVMFFDRSFFTHLTYAYAYSKMFKIPSFSTTIELYQKAIEDKKLIIPDVTIDINVSSDESIFRQNNKILENPQKALPEFRRNKDFLNDLLLAYIVLYKNYSGSLLSLDGKLTTEEKIEKVLSFDYSSITPPQLDLERYLSELL